MKLCQKWLLVKASFFKRKKAENLFHTRDNTQYKKSSHLLLYAFYASILWDISLFDCTLCHCFSIIYSIWILFFRQTNCGVFFCCFDVIMTTTPCYYLCSTTFKKVLLRIHIFTYARHSINLHALKHRTSEQNFGGGISSQTLKVSDMLKFSKTHGGLCRI